MDYATVYAFKSLTPHFALYGSGMALKLRNRFPTAKFNVFGRTGVTRINADATTRNLRLVKGHATRSRLLANVQLDRPGVSFGNRIVNTSSIPRVASDAAFSHPSSPR